MKLSLYDKHTLIKLLAVAALLVLVQLLPASWQAQLSYQTQALNQHEYWRLLTGQLVHLRWEHLAFNLLGLVVIGLLFSRHIGSHRFLPALLACMLGSNLGMWLADPQITHYVGFSGVLYGLFAWGACWDVLTRQRFGMVLLALVLAKTTYDYVNGATFVALSDAGQVAFSAHFYGVIAGVLVAILSHNWYRIRSLKAKRTSKQPS